MKNPLIDFHRDVQHTHTRLIQQLSNIAADPSIYTDLSELADTIYALQESIKYLEEVLKKLKGVERTFANFFGSVMLDIEAEHGEQVPIETEYTVATVKTTEQRSFPHKRRNNEKTFDAIMAAMGVPAMVSEFEALRINWNGFNELNTYLTTNGYPPLHTSEVTIRKEVKTKKRKQIS